MNTQKIVGGLILLVVLGLGGFKYYEFKNPEKFKKDPIAIVNDKPSQTIETLPSGNIEKANKSINVNVGVPINGTIKGVIEVGASGFNSFVINMDSQGNWEIISKEFGESLAYEGFITLQDIISGTKKYVADLANKGAAGRNIHFVMSSGALKSEKAKQVAEGIEKAGYVVNRVTAEQEGKYALRALLPKDYKNNSYIVDIGSGNTKISWYEGESLKSVECYGAKYYQNEVKVTDQEVYEQVKNNLSKVPENQRVNCFIIGGVPYNLAKKSRNGNERFTLLNSPDSYSAGDDVKLRSGLNIYRALYDNSNGTQFIFDWDANFTIGFLLKLN